MIIDEDRNLKEDLISNSIGNYIPSTRIEHEGASAHKECLLKHEISRTSCPKSFDRIKRVAAFSLCNNVNVSSVARDAVNAFLHEDNNSIFLSEGHSFAFVGK